MATPPIISALDTKVQEFRLEGSRRSFVDELAHLITALGTIPDLPPGDVGAGDRARLREIADEIIEAIERRIDGEKDSESTKQHLASSIYEVRRRMEVIEAWLTHRGFA